MSRIARAETNDCVVRSFASAFNVSYDDAHEWARTQYFRKNRDGTRGTAWTMDKLKEQFNHKVEALGTREFGYLPLLVNKNRNLLTVGAFMRKYPEGVFIIFVRGHAFTIRDGVVFGNHEDSRKLRAVVKNAFRITPLSPPKRVKAVAVESGTKVCSCCGKKKAITEFNKDGSKSGDGRRSRCKPCHKAWRASRIEALKKV